MAGAAGAKNVYRSGVLVGNWNEDTWGAALVRSVEESRPVLGTSQYVSSYASPAGFEPSAPALRGFDALDGHLMMAHAPSAAEIAARREAPERFVTLSEAAARGAPPAAAVSGKISRPGDFARTDLTASKARMVRAWAVFGWWLFHCRCCHKHVHTTTTHTHNWQVGAGLDAWDVEARGVPRVPMTVTPKVTAADVARVAPAATLVSERHYRTAAGTAAATTAIMAATSGARGDTGHGRQGGFTRDFSRTISGLRE